MTEPLQPRPGSEIARNPLDTPETISKLEPELKEAFFKDLHNLGSLTVGERESSREVAELAKECELAFAKIRLPITDIKLGDLVRMKRKMINELKGSINMKAFLSASDMETFTHYFPNLRELYPKFASGRRVIARTMQENLPALEVRGYIQNDENETLERAMCAVIKAERENEIDLWEQASEEAELIELMIQFWNGNHAQGIRGILNAVMQYKLRYSALGSAPSVDGYLYRLLCGYPEAGRDLIAQWRKKEGFATTTLPIEEIAQKFCDNQFPILSANSLSRQTGVTVQIALEFLGKNQRGRLRSHDVR